MRSAYRRGTFTPPPFAPSDIDGLELWLESDHAPSVVSSGGLVSQWRDRSGNNRHVSPSAGREPATGTRTLNGLNALDFDQTGTGDQLRLSGLGLSQPFTVYVVFSADALPGGANRYLDGYDGATGGRAIFHYNGSVWTMQAGSAVNTLGGSATATPLIHRLVYDGGSSYWFENGVQKAGPMNPGTGGLPDLNISGDSVGSDGGVGFDGLIGAYLIYSGAHGSTEADEIEAYLAKWIP